MKSHKLLNERWKRHSYLEATLNGGCRNYVSGCLENQLNTSDLSCLRVNQNIRRDFSASGVTEMGNPLFSLLE